MTSQQQAAADCVVVGVPAASDYQVVGVPAASDDYHVPTGGGGLHLPDHRHHVVDVDRDLVVGVPCGDSSGHVELKAEGHVEIKVEGHVELKAEGHHVEIKAEGHVEIKAEEGHVELKNDDDDDRNPCLVCKKPMSWVAVGRCGHGAVCSKCMVEVRFYQKNKRCCICRTHCPKVLVTKAEAVSDAVATLLRLPRFVFRDGRVSKAGKYYWYHGHTAAYFEDENQYQHARTECHGIIRPFYKPVLFFAIYVGFLIVCGALVGSAFASEAKHLSSRVRAYPISIFIWVSVGVFFWSAPSWVTEPDDLEHWRNLRSTSS